MRYQSPRESYQDYLQSSRPHMRIKSFDEYGAGRVAAMELFERMRPTIRRRRTAKQTSKTR